LFDEWDALVENLRLVEVPLGAFDQHVDPSQARGVVAKRVQQKTERVIVDTRVIEAAPANSRALNLDELFIELNA
jgi:hypothetical protein